MYEAYGQIASMTGSSANPVRFLGALGYFYGAGAGTYYVRARQYAPALARWLSEDPIGLVAGPNRYQYVGDNPANTLDPLGLWKIVGVILPQPTGTKGAKHAASR